MQWNATETDTNLSNMKKHFPLFSFSQIISLSVTVTAIQNHHNKRSDDPFAQVFEGSGEDEDVISDTGQYKFVGNLFPKNPIMPDSRHSEVVSGAQKGWNSIKGITIFVSFCRYTDILYF